jgi:hypothetical protein
MRTHYTRCEIPNHPTKDDLIFELHGWARKLYLSSLDEAIRLIESDKVGKLNDQHIHRIAEYREIIIDGERFFHRAFSGGKEVAACLAYAMWIGWPEVLDDMQRFRLSVVGSQQPRSDDRGACRSPGTCAPEVS